MKHYINNCKKISLIKILYFFIISFILQCIPINAPSVNIRSDIVELKHPISGSIGFCSIFTNKPEGSLPLSQGFGRSGLGKNMNNLQKDLFDILGNKIAVDCRYDRIQDVNFIKPRPDLLHVGMYYGTAIGYLQFYDEKDAYGNWKMWRDAYIFFNKYFKCDYYLTGKFYFVFTDDSDNKRIGIEPNILLIIYDYRGFRVWSKLYKKQYYYVEKDVLTADILYPFVKNMLNDNKELIKKDLSSIIVSNDKK